MNRWPTSKVVEGEAHNISTGEELCGIFIKNENGYEHYGEELLWGLKKKLLTQKHWCFSSFREYIPEDFWVQNE